MPTEYAINVIPIPVFKDNYVWTLINEADRSALVVDPGAAKPVYTYLQHHQLKLKAILVTHHHWDHTNGVRELKNQFNVPVFASSQEKIQVEFVGLNDQSTIDIEGFPLHLQSLAIPGHTLGHMAFYADDMVFCGDTLFGCGCGKLFEGSAQQMFDSLQKIASLPDDTKIYCGHEYTLNNLRFAEIVEPTNQHIFDRIRKVSAVRKNNQPSLPSLLREEKETNPFLRCDSADVIASTEKHTGRKLTDPVAVFAALRQWKDNFS